MSKTACCYSCARLAPSVTTAIPPASTAGRPQTARSSLSASVRSIRVSSTATRRPRLNGIKHGMLISWRRRPGGSSAAYAYLRDHDLTFESETSRRLRQSDHHFRSRIGDELRELAGVMDGEHRHAGREPDVLLESSQVIYWLLLESLRNGVTWMTLRPDRALATVDDQLPVTTVSRLLRAEADRGSDDAGNYRDVAAAAHATLSLVGQACVCAGLDPLAAVQVDLAELESRPYLAPYFRQGST